MILAGEQTRNTFSFNVSHGFFQDSFRTQLNTEKMAFYFSVSNHFHPSHPQQQTIEKAVVK